MITLSTEGGYVLAAEGVWGSTGTSVMLTTPASCQVSRLQFIYHIHIHFTITVPGLDGGQYENPDRVFTGQAGKNILQSNRMSIDKR